MRKHIFKATVGFIVCIVLSGASLTAAPREGTPGDRTPIKKIIRKILNLVTNETYLSVPKP